MKVQAINARGAVLNAGRFFAGLLLACLPKIVDAEGILKPDEIWQLSSSIFTGETGTYEYFKDEDAACEYALRVIEQGSYVAQGEDCGFDYDHFELVEKPGFLYLKPMCFAVNWCNWASGQYRSEVGERAELFKVKCTAGQSWMKDGEAWACQATPKCPSSYVFSPDSGKCEAYCTAGASWDSTAEQCVPPQEEESCKTQGGRPIDFFQGRKYRSEAVIDVGGRSPVSLRYFYNNQGNHEKAPNAAIYSAVPSTRFLAAARSPVSGQQFQDLYDSNGLEKANSFWRPTQYYGNANQYWRHNFDDSLQVHSGLYNYQPAKGHVVRFEGLGSSRAYPHLELGFDGSVYRLVDHKLREVRLFDQDGRLIRIDRGPDDTIILSYDSEGRLERIVNSLQAFIRFEYESIATDSIYSAAPSTRSYPVRVLSSAGESVTLEWNHHYRGHTATFPMLTFISDPGLGEVKAGRSFSYNDSGWPASLTDIYRVNEAGERSLFAHFEYDDQGRAVYSGLADGFEADRVQYLDEFTRIVTNVLNKQATYTFADIDGVRRLQSVTGEPTQNCVTSEVSYQYDRGGNVSQKLLNGQVTEYQYDSFGRETSRTEAAGTPEARTVLTEYHSTLNLPVKVTEPGKVTTYTYDAEGRLISQHAQSTATP